MLSTLFYILAAPLAFSQVAGSNLVGRQTTPAGPLLLHPDGDVNKCLDVRGGMFVNGTPVQIFDCNNSPAQKWAISDGNTKVQVFGTNFCLDAGSTPANGVGMKIWECYDNLPAQAWFYPGDTTVALARTGLCLDLPNGVHVDGNQVQTKTCTDGDTNQVWTEGRP